MRTRMYGREASPYPDRRKPLPSTLPSGRRRSCTTRSGARCKCPAGKSLVYLRQSNYLGRMAGIGAKGQPTAMEAPGGEPSHSLPKELGPLQCSCSGFCKSFVLYGVGGGIRTHGHRNHNAGRMGTHGHVFEGTRVAINGKPR